jgi:hypothetical protein
MNKLSMGRLNINKRSINSNCQQSSPRPVNCLWTFAYALLGLSLVSSASTAQEPQSPEQSSWYQVEVVIFTQQGYAGSEQPPKKYTLDFPENTLELLDTDYIGNNYPTTDYDALEAERAIPVVNVEDPALMFAPGAFGAEPAERVDSEPLITPLLVSANAENSATTVSSELSQREPLREPLDAPEEIYIPEYEKPFIKLGKQFRDLNDSVRALDRRAKYNVVFHEAWRFAADKKAADPWVIIKAGKQYQDRFEIEGSLRFYKSRFLHFQSDLWFLNFADQTDSVKLIELPAFPVMPEQTLSEGQSLELLIDDKELENFFIGSAAIPVNDVYRNKGSDGRDSSEKEQPLSPLQPSSYPVSSLWVFDQSKRIEQQQSYYLDHPKMGILVTIKSHEVVITNPQEEQVTLETASVISPE